MPTAKELAFIMSDLRLTPAARCIVAHVYLKGDGEHEISLDELSAVLLHPNLRKLQEAIRIGRNFGYLQTRPGGRGHATLYRYSSAPGASLNADSSADSASLKHDSSANSALLKQKSGSEQFSDANSALLKDSDANSALLNESDARSSASHTSPREEVVGGGGGTPSYSPPRFELAADAVKVLDERDEQLRGCRGPLRDYLIRRVPTDSQYGYVQSVVGWLEGTEHVWRTPTGNLPSADYTKALAAALNDLLADPKSERGRARPPGDVANLRTKLRIILNPRSGSSTSRPSNGGGGRPSKPTPQQFDYSNATKKFRGFTP